MTFLRKSGRPRVWPQRDRQQTTAVVREGDLAEKKTSLGWMGGSWTKFSSWQPLLNKYSTVRWRPIGTHSLIFIYSLPPLISFSLFVISESRSIYQINFSYIYFPPPVSSLSLSFSSLPLSFLWHFSISRTYQFLFPKGFNGSSVPFPVIQTPVQTNIVFNALLLAMNPSGDLGHTPGWLVI